MKIAVAGCGSMGKLFAQTIAGMDGIELSGVFTKTPENARQTAEQFHTTGYVDYDRLLDIPGLDAVCITLPTFLHKDYALRAAERGVHVICEKPLALSQSDAQQMADACERAGVKLLVGHVLRFFSEYRDLARHVASGRIGKVGVAHAKRASLFPPAGSWFLQDEHSGGVIFDLMVHDIDFLRSILGEVKTVFSMRRRSAGVDYATSTLRFEGGAIANLEAMWGHPDGFHTEIELAGQKGIVRGSSRGSSSLTISRSRREGLPAEGVIVPQIPAMKSPFQLELEHFIDCIQGHAEPLVTAQDACKAIEIAEAAVRSSRTGRPVHLSAESGSWNGGAAL